MCTKVVHIRDSQIAICNTRVMLTPMYKIRVKPDNMMYKVRVKPYNGMQ